MTEQKVTLPSIKDVADSAWEKLAHRKIYFGHQSVGYNIIEGIKDLLKENPQIELNVIETADPKSLRAPILAHSRLGKNGAPGSKIDAFSGLLKGGLREKTDIAFFKFCYVDISPKSDVKGIFSEYRKTMDILTREFPKTKFFHVTVPLTARQGGAKALVKKLIGKPIGGREDNMKRTQYNRLLKEAYDGKAPLFDLAGIESTSSNGNRSSFSRDGTIYYSLVPEYTNDGGHLNELGRRIVAEQLLIFLANLSE
jgi:hypothetical protein